MRTNILILLLVLTLPTACKTPEEGMLGEPPEEGEDTRMRQGGPRRLELPKAKETEQPERDYPDPLFTIDGWPFQEPATTFSLEWAGQAAVLPIHYEPSRNATIVGKYEVSPGQAIPWRNTQVAVFKPKLFRATKTLTLEGFLWRPDNRALHRQPTNVPVPQGGAVAVYHYHGRDMCIVGAADKLVEAACPTPKRFEGNFAGRTMAEKMQADRRIWWVQITTPEHSGWIALDDRVAVDIEQL